MRPLTPFVTALGIAIAGTGLQAQTHRYVPKAFVDTYSGKHAPVLTIKSGDRVVTSTLDDMGAGADGTRASEGTIPQTGPFFVEGAEPGDLLVVTLEKLTPNRATGFSMANMLPSSVDAGAIQGRPDPNRVPWEIDAAKGVVRLDLQKLIPNTDWKSRFAVTTFEMPLEPSLGSIGVAPADTSAPAASAAGSFGGNMIAKEIVAGTRVMLPVSQAGALLFLGHGHARQGDGAVVGAGIETSLDVEFSVEVVKKKEWPHSSVVRPSTVVGEFPQDWPRIESKDALMTVASGKSLLEALQHATIELHHWLDDDFGLSEKTTNIFIGQAIEYEITNISEPNVTILAKVKKGYLPKALGQ